MERSELELLSKEDLIQHILSLQEEISHLKGETPPASTTSTVASVPVVDTPPSEPAVPEAVSVPGPESDIPSKPINVAPERTASGEELWKVVLLGEGAVGKTSVTIQLIERKFVTDYDPTIENSYRRVLRVDEVSASIEILDTAGQEEYAVMREQYIRQGQGFVLVFTLTDSSTLEGMQDFYEQILVVKHAERVPVVVLGNKNDLVDQRQVPRESAEGLTKKYGIPYYETSALTGENIDEAFSELVRLMRKNAENPAPIVAKPGKRGKCNLM